MKDISIYFTEYAKNQSYSKGQIGEKVRINSDADFELPIAGSIALIFVPEYRNSHYKKPENLIEQIRQKFFNLMAGEWQYKIYDLGCIHPGKTPEDTYVALAEVVHELVKAKVFPVVIGGSNDLAYAIYRGYQHLEQTVNIIDIDASLDMGNPADEISASNWLSKIIVHKPGYLFNYCLLGYQSYFVNPDEMALLEKMYFDAFRLGEFYTDEKMVEPLVRNADILCFDLNAIRSSDYHGNSAGMPHGFYGEDACRIMRYAGWSDKLTSLGLFNITEHNGSLRYDANLIAQMMWYFVEGFHQRKKDYPVGSKSSYTKYTVSLDDFKDQIIFYKSDKSGRWWMEVPYPKVEGMKYQRHLLIPCTYEVYQKALQNEMPNLWWKTFQKLS